MTQIRNKIATDFTTSQLKLKVDVQTLVQYSALTGGLVAFLENECVQSDPLNLPSKNINPSLPAEHAFSRRGFFAAPALFTFIV